MDSNRTLVDNFLNGNTNLSMPVMAADHNDNYNNSTDFSTMNSNIRNLSTLDSQGEMQERGYSTNMNSATHVLALQQRLFVLLSEAQGIITQLQQYGCFPKMPQSSGVGPAANAVEGKDNNGVKGPLAVPPANQNTDPPLMLPKYQQKQPSSLKPAPWEVPAPDVSQVNSPMDSPALWESMRMAGTTSVPNYCATNANLDANGGERAISSSKNTSRWDAAGSGTGQDYANEPQRGKVNSTAANQFTTAKEYEPEDAVEYRNEASHGAVSGPAEEQIVYVEFKRKRIHKYVCHDPTICPGVYVLVDGDRGTDCGLVTRTVRWLPNGEPDITSMDDCDIDEQKIKPGNGYVLRQATNDELDKLHNVLSNAESVALKTCRQRCQEFGIDIKLIDAEYQFDMKKISFFYDSDRSIDFRALVRELYRTFGARIWMENVNPKVKNCMPSDSGACSPTCSVTREPEVGNGNRHSHNTHRRK